MAVLTVLNARVVVIARVVQAARVVLTALTARAVMTALVVMTARIVLTVLNWTGSATRRGIMKYLFLGMLVLFALLAIFAMVCESLDILNSKEPEERDY